MNDAFRNKSSFYLLAFLLLLLVFYQQTVLGVVSLWLEDGYSHGFLLLAVAIYLTYQLLRSQDFNVVFSPSIVGSALLLLLAMIWLAARLTFVLKIEQISLPFIIAAFIWALLGYRQASRFFFPILLMLLSVPVVELFNVFFQYTTAFGTGVLLDLTGVPAVVEGLLIHVPAGSFEVDTSCSGVRVVNVGVVLALLYAYMNRLRYLDSLIFVGLTIAVSFFCNFIRVYIIVVVGNMTAMQHPLVEDHGHLGWFVFAIVISIYLFLVSHYWPHRTRKARNDVAMTAVTITDVSHSYRLGAVLLIMGLGVGMPAGHAYLQNQSTSDLSRQLDIPRNMGDWQQLAASSLDWKPAYNVGTGDIVSHQVYAANNQKVYHYLSYFSHQTRTNEIINVNNRVYDRRLWSKISSSRVSVKSPGMPPVQVEEVVIRQRQVRDMLVWRVYIVNGKLTGNQYLAKLYNLWGILMGDPAISVYIVATELSDSHDKATARLFSYWQASKRLIMALSKAH